MDRGSSLTDLIALTTLKYIPKPFRFLNFGHFQGANRPLEAHLCYIDVAISWRHSEGQERSSPFILQRRGIAVEASREHQGTRVQ